MKQYVALIVYQDGTYEVIEITAKNRREALIDLDFQLDSVLDQIKKMAVVSR